MSSKEAMQNHTDSCNLQEVLRATIDATNALVTVSQLIPDAMTINPKVKPELQSYEVEIRSSKRVIDLIRSQKGLQTSGVVAGIRMIQSHGEILRDDLMCIEEKDGKYLKKTLEILQIKRMSVTQQIRIAAVGLSKSDVGGIIVQTKVVESTNEAVKKSLGKDSGLVIASFLAKLKHTPDASGQVRLTERDYEKLIWQQIQTEHPETKSVTTEVKTRIVCNCLARGQSIQILGPVAVDLWAGIAFIKIEGLIAMDQAIQFAYPVTLDVFREGLDRQEKRISSSWVKEIRG
ncbi:hypothetical protein VTL71DRAFT_11185 [Oculimacula yallundae]|uniref:Uncharacterized protein n=1 Tax=Oculimacula yallundae TaxID=86028 RepID=A0ABR4CVC7_9HELO